MSLKYFSGSEKKRTMYFFRRLKKMSTTTRSKRQLDSCCLNSELICILSFFWQVEDLAQQAECPDIEVLPDVSEKEVKTQ